MGVFDDMATDAGYRPGTDDHRMMAQAAEEQERVAYERAMQERDQRQDMEGAVMADQIVYVCGCVTETLGLGFFGPIRIVWNMANVGDVCWHCDQPVRAVNITALEATLARVEALVAVWNDEAGDWSGASGMTAMFRCSSELAATLRGEDGSP